MSEKKLVLVVDMYGFPNRCKHCWLGHMPNINIKDGEDQFIVDFFKPYFETITYYSWVREPDFCQDYENRWIKDNQLSINALPERFELASFYKLANDKNYVKFLKKVGTKAVQLSFFGLEKMTDKYVGRIGAYKELIKATEALIDNEITPRWQAFINEENKDEIVKLLDLIKQMKLEQRCKSFNTEFKFFVHEGSCDGENLKLYNIRITKDHIPSSLIPYHLNFDQVKTEKELCQKLINDNGYVTYQKQESIVLNISNKFDVYFNFTSMKPKWKIGNLKIDNPNELIDKIVNQDILPLRLAKTITIQELVNKYGQFDSEKAFFEDDYKNYLLNYYIEDN
jgi:hypothetical protein